MDWSFIEEEILELLNNFDVDNTNVEKLEELVSKFVTRLASHYSEDEHDENGTDSNWADL